MGFKGAKVPLPYGPGDGDEGMRANIERLRKVRESVGKDFSLAVDCYMSLTVPYTIELARRIEKEVPGGVSSNLRVVMLARRSGVMSVRANYCQCCRRLALLWLFLVLFSSTLPSSAVGVGVHVLLISRSIFLSLSADLLFSLPPRPASSPGQVARGVSSARRLRGLLRGQAPRFFLSPDLRRT